jgi:uncharacterized OsmC-like protein
MTLKIKPKSFGPVYVISDGKQGIQYAYANPSMASTCPPVNSPVDTLIASVGSCIVKSVEWVANQRKVNLHPFTVMIVGIKSTELPGRIETVEITIFGKIVDNESLTSQIVKQAKSICTVSNTLNCDVRITVEPELVT